MKKHMLFVAAALFLFAAVPASAQYWGVPGSVGIIDEGSTSLYEFTGAALKFRSGQTGTIVARYPITSNVSSNPAWTTLAIAYSNPGLTVRVIELSHCLGFEDEIASTTITSGDPNSCAGLNISHTWDFANYSYYVEVSLTRSTTSGDPRLLHLNLQ